MDEDSHSGKRGPPPFASHHKKKPLYPRYPSNPSTSSNRRVPVILSKREKRDQDGESLYQNRQPTFILKTRESPRDALEKTVARSTSPSAPTRKDTASEIPVYQLATKQMVAPDVQLAPLQQMKSSVKLIDENLEIVEKLGEFLLEQPDFIVVGCIGTQGVGKSTILSLLAGCSHHIVATKDSPFKQQSQDQIQKALHCTGGIDAYMTKERIILLDCQPYASASILQQMIQLEKKHPPISPEFSPCVTAQKIHSLQLTAFLYSVCNVILVVQDWMSDPYLVQHLQQSEMLRPVIPAMSSVEDEVIEHSPQMMFIHNFATADDFQQDSVRMIQSMLSRIFSHSSLHIKSGLGIANGHVIPSLNPNTCGSLVNYFMLPDFTQEDDNKIIYKGHPGIVPLIQSLRMQVRGCSSEPVTFSAYSEKAWFHFALKTWDSIRKSSHFLEYSRSTRVQMRGRSDGQD